MTPHVHPRFLNRTPKPSALYISVLDDPRHNMVVTYHQDDDLPNKDVYYKKKGNTSWLKQTPDIVDFRNENKTIHHAYLSGLDANTEYEFKIGSHQEADINFFKTLPENLSADSKIKVVFCADIHGGHISMWKQMANIAGEQNPDLFCIGGDWGPRDDGRIENSSNWIWFWDLMYGEFTNSDGRLIPLVPVLGNHDISYGDMERPFLADMFPFPDEGENNYGVLDVGDYLSIFVLDTISMGWRMKEGNTSWAEVVPSMETQRNWLYNRLTERENQTYITASYHIPLYPIRNTDLEDADDFNLEEWRKLFADYFRVSFAGHAHIYNQSLEIIHDENEEENFREVGSEETGHTEFGDGGLTDRYLEPKLENRWYVDEYQENISFIKLLEINNSEMKIDIINHRRKTIHESIID